MAKGIQQDSSFEGSCYYWRNVCEKNANLIIPKCRPADEKQNIMTSDIGIQVGKSTIHHYLFDPTEDAIFDRTFQPNFQWTFGMNSNVAANSIIELMKKQLKLTELHMRSQKELYREYCRTIEKTQINTKNKEVKEKVLFGRSEKPKYCHLKML